MARTTSKPTVVNNQLHYDLVNGTQYIDIFRDLSALNRKLIRQGRIAYITDISYAIHSGSSGSGGNLFINALPNDWVHNNSWKKGQAHWLQQQRRARKLVGRSAKPTWEDFKVYYDASHRTGTTLDVPSLSYGEWVYSVFHVEAEDHSVQEWYLHVQGDDVSTTDRGLVLGYEESRATVQSTSPDVPSEYGNSMYANLADDIDDVARDVAADMEDENDEPPYDHNDYPGNDSNAVIGHHATMLCSPVTSAIYNFPGVICAPLGLLKLIHSGLSGEDGSTVTAPTAFLQFRIAYGNYKGLAAPSFGQ